MALNARQQKRLQYLQRVRPNDPQVAKLQGKMPQSSLPVSRTQGPQIQRPQELAPVGPMPEMNQMDPQAVDPGRYQQEQMIGGAPQQPQNFGMYDPKLGRRVDFAPQTQSMLRRGFAEGAMKGQQQMQNQSNPYGVLK